MVSLAGSTGFSQPSQLPPPEATDPVARGTMMGVPPPPDERVTLGNVFAYSNARCANAHLFVGSKAPCFKICDDLPQHLERP